MKPFITFLLLLGLATGLNAQCTGFTASFTSSDSGLTKKFVNTSTSGASSFSWTFGDGGTSTSMNPNHTYPANGTYTVCLIAQDVKKGCADTTCDTVVVNACASFHANFTSTGATLTKFFTNTSSSTATYFSWNFGDGGTSNAKNTNHTYAANGTYNVCLIASDTMNGCWDTICHTVVVNACSGFTANFTSSGSGATRSFTNTSTSGASSFSWTFGDGGTSTSMNPSHTYASSGTYTVCLVAQDTKNGCKDSICHTVTVISCSSYHASFTSSGTGFSKSFTNTTSGSTNVFKWYFGDGGTSTATSPSHTYSTGGTYNVCLVARDTTTGCADSVCHTITACGSFANFAVNFSSLNTTFINTSTAYSGTTNTYLWDFGDGSTSTSTSPTHTYSAAGTYTVCLIAISSGGCMDSICKSVTVVDCSSFSAGFTFTDSCQQYKFTNTSSGGATATYWSFGDGTNGFTTNPTHTYATTGSYTICLIAEDKLHGCWDTACHTITIEGGVRGHIYRDSGNAADSGMVYLVKVTIDTIAMDTILTAVDSTMITAGGYYSFSSLVAGNYLVKAALLPGSAYYSTRIPTYYGGATLWRYAGVVNINSACTLADITLVTGTNPGGSGFIGGYVSVGANKTGDPLTKIQVSLYNTSNMPAGYTYTDAGGHYQFNNLAFGTYTVNVEIPGKPCQQYPATLTQANPSVTHADFEVNTKDITIKTATNTGIASITKGHMSLYPNPAKNTVNLAFEAAVEGNTTITLTDIAGKQVKTINYAATAGSNVVELDINTLDYGFYLVTVKAGNQLITGKLSISK